MSVWLVDAERPMYHNDCLFDWHAITNVTAGPNVDRPPQAEFVLHPSHWLLVNQ